MEDRMYDRITIVFERGKDESSSLKMVLDERGLYGVKGAYVCERGYGFPAREVVNRTGSLYPDDLDKVMDGILTLCRKDWYHHYRRDGMLEYVLGDAGRWSIRVECQGVVERWEGVGHAPKGIDGLYGEMVSLGMPPLRIGSYNRDSFESVCRTAESTPLEPWHITCYEQTLAEYFDGTLADFDPDSGLVVGEFFDDLGLYLQRCCPDALDAAVFDATWNVEESVAGLCRADESTASRRKVFLLFGALTRVCRTPDDLHDVVTSGAFARWCERLRELPREELVERRKRQERQRVELNERIDESVRRLAASKTPFTSYDVAKECGISAQQASGRIRGFVRRGEIEPMEGAFPRKYRAA